MNNYAMPDNFLWGGATSDFQYEGGFNEGGRGLLTHDFETDGSAEIPRHHTMRMKDGTMVYPHSSFGSADDVPKEAVPVFEKNAYYPSHKAVDFYHHYKEDIALMAGMGFKVFRFSICWSRIYPTGEEEKPNQEGLVFYDNVLSELEKYHIEPLITICHDEMPMHLALKYNGWASRHLIDCYLKYCRTLFERYGKRCRYWLTFNEINAVKGFGSLGTRETDGYIRYLSCHHMFLASSRAVSIGHQMMPGSKFGAMYASSEIYPSDCRTENMFHWMKERQENWYFIDIMSHGEYPRYSRELWKHHGFDQIEISEEDKRNLKNGTLDFIGFSYYRSSITEDGDAWFNVGGKTNPYLEKTPWGWSVDPLGLRTCMNEIYDRSHLPVFIVENGLGAIDHPDQNGYVKDDYRIDYLMKHLRCMMDAIMIDGVECLGYTMWGPIDLVSLSTGEMKKRYGLIYVDMDDKGNGSLKRIPKKSYEWMKKVIATNGMCLMG